MPKVTAFISYGQGGAGLDWLLSFGGTSRLNARAYALGVDTPGPYSWDQARAIADKIKALPADARVVVGGTSLGANEAPRIGTLVGRRPIDFMFGIQPSLFGAKNSVTPNVKRAMFFRNPVWPITMGLGAYQWVRAPGNHATTLIEQTSYAPHPGDNVQWIQDVILAEIRKLM